MALLYVFLLLCLLNSKAIVYGSMHFLVFYLSLHLYLIISLNKTIEIQQKIWADLIVARLDVYWTIIIRYVVRTTRLIQTTVSCISKTTVKTLPQQRFTRHTTVCAHMVNKDVKFPVMVLDTQLPQFVETTARRMTMIVNWAAETSVMVPKSKKLTMENVNWVIRNPLFCKDGKRPWNVTRSVRRLRRVHRTAKSSTTLLINCCHKNHVKWPKWHRTNKLSRWNAISLGNHLAILFTISPKQQTNRTCFLFLTVWIQINFIKNVIRYRLNIVAKI